MDPETLDRITNWPAHTGDEDYPVRLAPRPPAWAEELVDRVWEDLRPRRKKPVIEWVYRGGLGAAGRCYPGHYRPVDITIWTCEQPWVIDHPRLATKMVLLHELAHYLLPVGEHHSTRFWSLAWSLFERYFARSSLPIIYDWETSYMRRAAHRAPSWLRSLDSDTNAR